MQYVFYGDELPPAGSNVLLLSNHQCSSELQQIAVVSRLVAFVNMFNGIHWLHIVDWLLLEFLSLRVGAGGHMRYILKKVLGLMPLYGFMVHRHGGIFVRQGGRKDAEEIRRKLKQMANLKQPVSDGRSCVGS